jgi:hypothetical protein
MMKVGYKLMDLIAVADPQTVYGFSSEMFCPCFCEGNTGFIVQTDLRRKRRILMSFPQKCDYMCNCRIQQTDQHSDERCVSARAHFDDMYERHLLIGESRI